MEKDKTVHAARAAPMRLAFRVSYLGNRFFGSQMQIGCRTVEGEFVAACQHLGVFSDWREAGFLFSGRTDRGVHALGQVVAFTTDVPDRAIMILNLTLPPDCWCTGYLTAGVPGMRKCPRSFTRDMMRNPEHTGTFFPRRPVTRQR
jgi:tRNA pseudouridine38-40 synthase